MGMSTKEFIVLIICTIAILIYTPIPFKIAQSNGSNWGVVAMVVPYLLLNLSIVYWLGNERKKKAEIKEAEINKVETYG